MLGNAPLPPPKRREMPPPADIIGGLTIVLLLKRHRFDSGQFPPLFGKNTLLSWLFFSKNCKYWPWEERHMRALWFSHFSSFWDNMANFMIWRDLRGDGGGEEGGWWLGCQNARHFYDKKSALSVQNLLVRGCPWIYPTFVWISADRLLACHVRCGVADCWGTMALQQSWRPNSPWAEMRTRTVWGNPEPSNFDRESGFTR